MLTWIIDLCLRHRVIVLLLALAGTVAGCLTLPYLDIDAFPDTTPVQVQINTNAPSLAPEEVEQQITFPIEQALSGLPALKELRSVSKFGLSQVVITFEDGTDIYFARQLISERLSTVTLPEGLNRPKLGPVATGVGEVFHYILTYKGVDFSAVPEVEKIAKLTELRTLHDWVVRPTMRTVPGVAEINSWGGYEKQYQVRIDPLRLVKYNLTFTEIFDALGKNNHNVGGGSLRQGDQMVLIHGLGRTSNEDQIEQIIVTARDGVPIRVRDVAQVKVGYEIRRGAITADGKGEAVLGLGFMRMGENSNNVTTALKNRLEEVAKSLPPDVQIENVYDRTELVAHVIETVRKNLFEGGLCVVAVLFLFLGNLRASLLVALAIPLSMLFAFSGMLRFGIAASLLSLGAIDFGMVVDSSVVMVENCVRHLSHGDRDRSMIQIVRDAAIEVRKPTLFGELIIMIVYVPILTFEGVEGKMFRPMALTVIFALAGSMVLSMTLLPVLASLVLPRHMREREPLLMRLAHWAYTPLLRLALRFKAAVLLGALGVLFVAVVLIAPNLGSEFVPRLSEGALVLTVVRLAGTDLDECVRYNTMMEKTLLAHFPDEVAHVWTRIGSAEIATDPMGVEETDFFISLKPREKWRPQIETQADLTKLIEEQFRDMPGQALLYSQPIEQRVNEMTSGVKADLAVKIFGDDLKTLLGLADAIAAELNAIPGHADVKVDQVTGQPILQIRVDQEAIAHYGITANAVLDVIESLGTKPIGDIVEAPYRFPLVVRLPESYRARVDQLGQILLPTAAGERIPLARLAKFETVEGASTISRESGQRRISVSANVRDRDLGSFVKEAQKAVAAHVPLPSARYRLEWGGQFEHAERAWNRLLIVVPIALSSIFVLLFFTYNSVLDALRVLCGVPFAAVGGIFALWLRDMPFSISAGVGFIALSGVAVLDDMILVTYIRQLLDKGLPLHEAVVQGSTTRLRPVLMTTLVASLGFVPMAFNTSMGAEVQRPLATVVIGGVVSAMVMSLFVLRVFYVVLQSPFERRRKPAQ
ncbi:MAG TPA: CusA/CzcA family heavy metal efflux RND transporter [Gemmataceae bacterium]|jgi:cobalt-zinc-cadmium resistance protein CzcA|nr:CusA/CzcA family heavy metal efflux RND transporter [Gemmataceae bacterium]